MAKTNTTISFISFSQFISDASIGLSLDDEYNEQIYGEAKSVFTDVETAYLKLLPGKSIKPSYVLGSSLGVLSLAQENVIYTVEEELNFINESSIELSQTPVGLVDYEWIGHNSEVPLFVDKLINLPNDVIGIMKVTYTVSGDRLKLSGVYWEDEEYNVLCVATYPDDTKVSATVSFIQSVPSTEVDVEIVVKDICNDEPIPNATVNIPGMGVGVTDEDGVFSLPEKLIVGDIHSILVRATGYTDSDEDFLNNDEFEVPAPSGD